MDDYNFLLASPNDIPEIINIYHTLIGTPGCTWGLDYPNLETAESDIKNESLYVLNWRTSGSQDTRFVTLSGFIRKCAKQ